MSGINKRPFIYISMSQSPDRDDILATICKIVGLPQTGADFYVFLMD